MNKKTTGQPDNQKVYITPNAELYSYTRKENLSYDKLKRLRTSPNIMIKEHDI